MCDVNDFWASNSQLLSHCIMYRTSVCNRYWHFVFILTTSPHHRFGQPRSKNNINLFATGTDNVTLTNILTYKCQGHGKCLRARKESGGERRGVEGNTRAANESSHLKDGYNGHNKRCSTHTPHSKRTFFTSLDIWRASGLVHPTTPGMRSTQFAYQSVLPWPPPASRRVSVASHTAHRRRPAAREVLWRVGSWAGRRTDRRGPGSSPRWVPCAAPGRPAIQTRGSRHPDKPGPKTMRRTVSKADVKRGTARW